MKKIEIEINERIESVKTYTVEVEDDVERWMVQSAIEDAVEDAVQPDDISSAFEDAGYISELTSVVFVEASYEIW